MKDTRIHRSGATLVKGVLLLAAVVLQRSAPALTVKNARDNAPKAALISGSLRWAIARTPANGTVDFDPSLTGKTILLTAGELVVDKALHVKGPGCDSLAVSGTNNGRVFFVSGTGDPAGLKGVIISGMTITRGKAAGPADDGVEPSHQGNGGGIYNIGVLKLDRVCITGNEASAGSGGGIYNRGVLNSIVECTISHNNAGQHGGGICNEQDMTIERSAIVSNIAAGDGGGVQEAGTSNVINSTIASNRAGGAGGGINDASGSTLKAYNLTIAGNAAAAGGGVAVLFGTWDIQNSIVADNTAPTAPDVRNIGDPGGGGAVGPQISVGNNLIGKTAGAGTGSFIASDKLDLIPKLGPLQNNGGPTPTMALLPGSAAIDSGDNRWIEPPVLEPALVSDQRGFMPRIINGGNGLKVDMGACEFATAKALKAQAITLLTPCRSSSDPWTARYATCAIRNIEISLDPRLWLSDGLLDECGELVFAFEREAVLSIGKLFKSGKDLNSAKAANDALFCMRLADEQIVRATIDAAVANSGGADAISSAREELSKGLPATGGLQSAPAIEHFEQAWKFARKAHGVEPNDSGPAACRALKIQLEKDDSDRWGNEDRCVGDDPKALVPGRQRQSPRPRLK